MKRCMLSKNLSFTSKKAFSAGNFVGLAEGDSFGVGMEAPKVKPLVVDCVELVSCVQRLERHALGLPRKGGRRSWEEETKNRADRAT